jgi:hypothetical protein
MTSRLYADSELIDRLFHDELSAVFFDRAGQLAIKQATPSTVLSGSFNPIHDAHWKLAEIAEQKTGRPTVFELSIINVDKPSLGKEEVSKRVKQFAYRASIWVTRAPTFAEKAKIFPHSTFAIGADTAERLLQPRYYGHDRQEMMKALGSIVAHGCSFLVAGRLNCQGRFCCLEDLQVPAEYCNAFTAIPRKEFDWPISSTRLRAAEEE